MQTIDMSLKNTDIYMGCTIEKVGGRLNLTTPIEEAVNIVGRNIAALDTDPEGVVLTGPMAVWSYLIVFHAIVHKTKTVMYCDGRNEAVKIAAHG